ncbi:MAG: hypothetical protein AVO39_05095 [delta proteobacterium MLS_D]|nr:MAG: hypothetical protein AVO39_05095 [delta proteobacterium MLS_D]
MMRDDQMEMVSRKQARGVKSGKIPFSKLVGNGNDFIIVDGRSGLIADNQQCFTRRVCERRRSVGADGVLVIEDSQTADFRLRIINADGSEADMCGNGARCAAVYARRKRIAPAVMTMETGAGTIEALVDGAYATIKMTSVGRPQPPVILSLEEQGSVKAYAVDSGVPHAVVFTCGVSEESVFRCPLKDVPASAVHAMGRAIRRHPRWGEDGSNADFVDIINSRSIYVRTWERGVEGETPACGTGAVASAFVARERGHVTGDTVTVHMPGGPLKVVFREGGKSGLEAWLAGDVAWSFDGSIYRQEERE